MTDEITMIKNLRTEIAKKSTLKEILINFKKTEKYDLYRNDIEMLNGIIYLLYDNGLVENYFTEKEIAEALDVVNAVQYFETTKDDLAEEMAFCEF